MPTFRAPSASISKLAVENEAQFRTRIDDGREPPPASGLQAPLAPRSRRSSASTNTALSASVICSRVAPFRATAYPTRYSMRTTAESPLAAGAHTLPTTIRPSLRRAGDFAGLLLQREARQAEVAIRQRHAAHRLILGSAPSHRCYAVPLGRARFDTKASS